MHCSVCGIEETSFCRARRPSGDVVHLCPTCYEREKGTLEPTGGGCGCLPAPLPPD